MHLSGYAVERKGLRKGIAELLQTCQTGAGWQKRAPGLQMAAPVSLCHDGEEKPGEYEQRMLHLYMIGQKQG